MTTQNSQNQLTTNDWNGRPATFRVGDRVLLHNDDGTLHQGTVTALLPGSDTDGSCEIAFDDGQAGSEGCWSLEVLN